ncbi:hypothetical protein D3C78_1760030 [compost metagenome]
MIHSGEEELVMQLAPVHASALVYVNDLLIEDALPRTVSLRGVGEATILRIAVKAEDHMSMREYRVTILKDE